MEMVKEEACWIWNEGNTYYCEDCVQGRVDEINTNREFADEILYGDGQECSYFVDVADEDKVIECCRCNKPLLSNISFK